jgi:protein O-GlcNAc transferase
MGADRTGNQNLRIDEMSRKRASPPVSRPGPDADADSVLARALDAVGRGDRPRGRKLCGKLLGANPLDADALHLLGVIEREEGNARKAVELIRRSLDLRPNVSAAHHNLGSALQDLGRLDEAEPCYRKVLSFNPRHARARYSLGCVLGKLGRTAEAVEQLRAAADLEPGLAEAHHNLGVYLAAAERLDEARLHAREAVSLRPQEPRFLDALARLLARDGEDAEALRLYDRCLDLRPGWIRPLWGRLHAMPSIYPSAESIGERRERWRRDLDAFADSLRLDSAAQRREAVDLICTDTNFFLHYQGCNDQALQIRYAEVLTRIAQAAFPAYAGPRRRPAKGDRARLRVGFVSAFFRFHSVYKTLGRWVTELDPKRFDTYAYHLGQDCDAATETIRNGCAQFSHLPGSPETIARRIDADDLDVLVYTDIGMDPRIQVLAPLRLAPVQASTWGHPITSGLRSIDYYLSSELMEPQDGEDFYSERLIRLPNLSVDYPAPDIAAADDSGIDDPKRGPGDERGPVFLCSQNLFKLLPDFDAAIVGIAEAVGPCRFWFAGGAGERFVRPFRARLAGAFADRGLDAEDYLHIFPRLSQAQFFGINRAADVLLDSFHWSGFNSTLEGLAMGRPVVTLPGASMRSRHTAACLWRMGLPELVARDAHDYLAIATRLGLDAEWRQEMATRVQERLPLLFDDKAPIRALETFLVEAAG